MQLELLISVAGAIGNWIGPARTPLPCRRALRPTALWPSAAKCRNGSSRVDLHVGRHSQGLPRDRQAPLGTKERERLAGIFTISRLAMPPGRGKAGILKNRVLCVWRLTVIE